LRLGVPAVLATGLRATGRPGLSERTGSLPGHRGIEISDGTATLPLEWAVPTPEVSGAQGTAIAAGTETWLLRWPPTEAQWSAAVAARPSLVILANARPLLAQGEPFVQAVREIRERLGVDPALYAPRVALPHRLALLTYLGVDIVDTVATEWAATEGAYFDLASGTAEPEPRPEGRSCACDACRADGAVDRTAHGLALLELERRAVSHSLAVGRLRELVESRLTAEPLLAELLRYGDGHLAAQLDIATPVVAEGIRTYVLRESHRRPEVRRYQERFQTRYRPPPSKNVLVVVPCSKTKPYRNSRSHRRFRAAVEDLRGGARLHFVSVTSPLGVVPRDIEDVPPARHYDIPVTGDWDEGERRTVREGIERLLSVGAYERVIVHLDENEYAFLRSAVPEALRPAWTVADGHSTSSGSLRALHDAAADALESTTHGQLAPLALVREELESIAAVQFGEAGARALFQAPVRLQGRPWFQKLTDSHAVDLATWREERGLFHLTTTGGQRLMEVGVLQVEVAPEVVLAGDLFVPGVTAADPEIRTGDAVLLVCAEQLLGVGEADIPGPWMTSLRRGRAVTVRHRVRGIAPGPTPT
jgi:archaeosine synthase alpha-subunit